MVKVDTTIKHVSIHAPTGGATPSVPGVKLGTEVSIHAPTGGATLRSSMCASQAKFQSTRPRGARHNIRTRCHPGYSRFNPRAHGGRDPARSVPIILHSVFQSTRPRGARHNPGTDNGAASDVSIHAPTGGATYTVTDADLNKQFQSTRPRGARRAAVPTDPC